MGAGLAAAALVVALIATGCGATGERDAGVSTGAADTAGAEPEALLPAPPIETVDEPVPKEALTLLAKARDGWTSFPPDEVCGPGCEEGLIEELERADRAGLPATRDEPRAVARLLLADGGAAYLAEYRSNGLGLCISAYTENADGLPIGSTPEVDCGTGMGPACERLCVFPLATPDGGVLLAGTVSAENDTLRVAFRDGYVARYPLAGPTLASMPDRRIFLAELQGHGMPTRLTLLEGENVVGEEGFPEFGGDVIYEEDAPATQTPDTVVKLDGTTLHVEIGPNAPRGAQNLLDDERVAFVCVGADDPEPRSRVLPPASTEGRFPPGGRSIDVELAAAPAGTLVMCGAGQPSGDGDGVYRLFLSVEELGKLYGDG